MTTQSHTGRSTSLEIDSISDNQQLPSGGLSLGPAFTLWLARGDPPATNRTSGRELSTVPRNTTSATTVELLGHGLLVDPQVGSSKNRALRSLDEDKFDMVEVLEYVRSAFQDEDFLDGLPIDMATNMGAWKAWQAYRGIKKPIKDFPDASGTTSPTPTHQRAGSIARARIKANKALGEWSWEGVWADRVARNVDASISKPVLYGSNENDMVGLSLL